MLPIAAAITRGGGDSLIKVGTDVRARALGISGVNFCPGIRFCKLNFARALGVWQLLTKKCLIFDKSDKSDLLAENFEFWHSEVARSLGFWAFCPGVGFFWENFARPRFCTRRTSVHTFIRKSPPSRYKSLDQRICYIVEW